MFDKPLPNSEPKLRELCDKLQAKHGTALVVVDQPASIGALPLTVARAAGCQVAYLPGLTMRRIADLYPGEAKTDARDAFVILTKAIEAPFRAPAACWWARTMLEYTDTSHSISPAASACACAAWSMRSKVPSAAHLRKRVWRLAHDPYRSGTSRHATPVRNFQTIPLRTVRSSSRGRPKAGWGSSGCTSSHSASDSSWRRITTP